MSMYKLGAQNFRLEGQTMAISVNEPIFVMFKLQGCKGCAANEPIFSQLANSERRISYGIIDLSEHKSVAQMSKSTTTVIQTVPSFIVYAGGKPKARFTSKSKTLADFMTFVSTVLPTLYQQPQSNVQMINTPPQQQQFVQQNMYGGQPMNGPQYAPDVQSAPRGLNSMLQGAHPNAQSSAHPSMKQCDPDDKECLASPHDVIPHNTPWEDKFRQLDL